jgi:anti-sigma factor RsiW
MKCNETRNLVLPYLDSELDARTTQEIELHLQSCSECARIFEWEGKFNERVFRVLRSGQSTPALWEQVEARLQPTRGLGWFLRRWNRMALGGFVASVIAVLVTVAVMVHPWASSLDLASVVKPDHAKYVAGQLKAQFEAQPPTAALAKEQGRLDAAAFSKLPAAPGFSSEGKRVCHLSGVPVAWIMGRDGQLPVSVVVLRRNELGHFPQLRQRLEAGHTVVCARTGRFEFAARVVGEHVVCAMAAMPRERLESLVRTVPAPPDAG